MTHTTLMMTSTIPTRTNDDAAVATVDMTFNGHVYRFVPHVFLTVMARRRHLRDDYLAEMQLLAAAMKAPADVITYNAHTEVWGTLSDANEHYQRDLLFFAREQQLVELVQ